MEQTDLAAFFYGERPLNKGLHWIHTHSIHLVPMKVSDRRGGLIISSLVLASSGPGSNHGRGLCVVFLGKTLYSHGASLHQGTGERNAGGNPAMDKHPIQRGEEILLVASCYRNWDKLRPDGPLGSSHADFTNRGELKHRCHRQLKRQN